MKYVIAYTDENLKVIQLRQVEEENEFKALIEGLRAILRFDCCLDNWFKGTIKCILEDTCTPEKASERLQDRLRDMNWTVAILRLDA
jgi:hypothetical protein